MREGSVYSREQFLDWMAPDRARFRRRPLGSRARLRERLAPRAHGNPRRRGASRGSSSATRSRRRAGTSAHLPAGLADLRRGDLVTADLGTFDLVYCIGVLHHLADPDAGFRSLLRHTRPGGRFHAWVYAREGNALVRLVVEPIRRVASRLPWWLTKYGLALPLVVPFFLYARLLRAVAGRLVRPETLGRVLPLAAYALWIAGRPFWFFHHVAFDQLVTPRTTYFDRRTVEALARLCRRRAGKRLRRLPERELLEVRGTKAGRRQPGSSQIVIEAPTRRSRLPRVRSWERRARSWSAEALPSRPSRNSGPTACIESEIA